MTQEERDRMSEKEYQSTVVNKVRLEDSCGTQAMRPMNQHEKLEELFRYHPPRPDQIHRYNSIRNAAKYLAEVIISNTPVGSDQSTAIRKLREAVMTANASIALDGLNF